MLVLAETIAGITGESATRGQRWADRDRNRPR
jgi:hypothetical protein